MHAWWQRPLVLIMCIHGTSSVVVVSTKRNNSSHHHEIRVTRSSDRPDPRTSRSWGPRDPPDLWILISRSLRSLDPGDLDPRDPWDRWIWTSRSSRSRWSDNLRAPNPVDDLEIPGIPNITRILGPKGSSEPCRPLSTRCYGDGELLFRMLRILILRICALCGLYPPECR